MRRNQIQLILLLALALALLGVPAAAAQSTDPDTRIDVVLVIDNSGSMHYLQKNDPQDLRISAAKMFASLMLEGDQLGIVSMEDRSTTQAYLDLTPAREISRSTWQLNKIVTQPDELSNWTYMGEALDLSAQVMENAARYNKQRAVIFLTDGLPTYRDEDRADQERKYSANVERLKAQGIKIFPIALGDQADPDFLQRTMADPTNGRVFRAATADQLITTYLNILTTLQDGRYIDAYEIIANGDNFLANVNPRQQIRQINFVFPALATPPTIQKDLVPGMRAGTQRTELYDRNWSMFVALPEYVPRFNGEWRINLESEQEQVPMIAVIKSDLRTRLIEPTSSVPDDEAAVRYYPAGRPLLLRAGARNRGDLWEKGTGLFVQMIEPEQREGLTLVDGGGEQDIDPADGQYAGGYSEPLAPGNYTLLVNASPTPTHLLLKKTYTLIVEPLPTMDVTLSPDGKLEVGEPIIIDASFKLDGQPVTVQGAEIIAAVKSEGKTIAKVPLEEYEPGVWSGEYLPDRRGELSFELTAHVEWESPDRGPRRYTDYVGVNYTAAQQAVVELNVPPVEDRVNGLQDGIQRTVEFRSYSDEPVELRLEVAGLPEARVYPDIVRIDPRGVGKRTITIATDAPLTSGEQEAKLVIRGDESIQLSASEIPITFTIRGFIERNSLALSGLVLLLFALSRRKVRAGLRDWWVRNVELLRYGGR